MSEAVGAPPRAFLSPSFNFFPAPGNIVVLTGLSLYALGLQFGFRALSLFVSLRLLCPLKRRMSSFTSGENSPSISSPARPISALFLSLPFLQDISNGLLAAQRRRNYAWRKIGSRPRPRPPSARMPDGAFNVLSPRTPPSLPSFIPSCLFEAAPSLSSSSSWIRTTIRRRRFPRQSLISDKEEL